MNPIVWWLGFLFGDWPGRIIFGGLVLMFVAIVVGFAIEPPWDEGCV